MDYLKPVILPGGTILPGNLFLAPTAGYSDGPFRSICRTWGADLCYTEMVSTEALWRGNSKTHNLLKREDNEPEYAIQLFGSDYDSVYKSLPYLTQHNPLLLDINAGCPVPKIIKSGAGSWLMKDPRKLMDIIKTIKDHTDIPLTIKLRLGWDANSINYLKIAQEAQELGIQAVGLHARTKEMAYRGKADWNHIKHLKENLDIPVFGSGDLFTSEDVIRMLTQTKCDGVLIARGAFGNPFIFSQIKGTIDKLNAKTIIDTALKHLDLSIQYYGDQAFKEIRKHFSAYLKGIPNSNDLRRKLMTAQTKDQYKHLLNSIL
ncbi:tRNA dihydrouridine synthase DusB [Spirochaeta cellobiosiphila]|uniref:tRNA dihydrouridine synthase DusB n=1 Tax=Spirochaeta cellobiosiphila TaxID=504483 RepID=UPI000418AE55|nr:tRNA dihydrouridine synthase DusB [Spirochaeta cellobiosiphila]